MSRSQDDPITALGEMDPKRLGRDEFVTLLEAASAPEGDGAGLSALPPEQFARIVSRATNEQLKIALGRPQLREEILEEVFRRMREHYTGGEATGTVRWRVDTGDDLLLWECELAGGECTVSKGSTAGEPRTTLTVPPLEFIKLASGNASPGKLLMTGRLKVSGDLTFAAALPKLFRIPQP